MLVWSQVFFVDCLYGFEINRLCCLHQQGLDYIVTVSLYSHWCVTCFICSLKPFLFVSAVWRASISSLCGLWMRLHSDCQQSDYMRPHSLQLPFAAEALALYRGSQEIADSNPFSLLSTGEIDSLPSRKALSLSPSRLGVVRQICHRSSPAHSSSLRSFSSLYPGIACSFSALLSVG